MAPRSETSVLRDRAQEARCVGGSGRRYTGEQCLDSWLWPPLTGQRSEGVSSSRSRLRFTLQGRQLLPPFGAARPRARGRRGGGRWRSAVRCGAAVRCVGAPRVPDSRASDASRGRTRASPALRGLHLRARRRQAPSRTRRCRPAFRSVAAWRGRVRYLPCTRSVQRLCRSSAGPASGWPQPGFEHYPTACGPPPRQIQYCPDTFRGAPTDNVGNRPRYVAARGIGKRDQ
jgi:hypothetical protein